MTDQKSDQPGGDGLREALEPFAKIADDYEASEQRRIRTYADEGRSPGAGLPDSHRVSISLGDCRNARLILDAILSLPAQPGAGEREAIIRECAEKVQSYLGATTESKRFGDEAYVMLAEFSRQAPPSSSEGK